VNAGDYAALMERAPAHKRRFSERRIAAHAARLQALYAKRDRAALHLLFWSLLFPGALCALALIR
jgi:hypothetical protein